MFPIIGDLPLDHVEPHHIADTLRPIWLEKPETAGRVKQRLHVVMAWGWAHGHCKANPVDVVAHLLPVQPSKTVRTQHQPAMPWRGIPKFVHRHLDTKQRAHAAQHALLFLILTAARSSEVRCMTWSEVDFNKAIWVVPASRMKAKVAHRVPLSIQALELLKRQQGLHKALTFPSINGRSPVSDMALTTLLRRLKAPSDVSSRSATAHGFRSSFRDWCSENGYARDLAERALAHTVQNKVEAAYHRTDLIDRRRPMMQAWADFVLPQLSGDAK